MKTKTGTEPKMKMKTVMMCLAAAALQCDAKTDAEEIKALRAEIASNSVDRTSKCRWWRAWYLDQCTEAERTAIVDRNVAAHRRWIAIAEKKGAKAAAKPRADLGSVLFVGGRIDEAERELSAALSSGGLSGSALADARWNLADCLWARGDRDGAKKHIADIAAMEGISGRTWDKAKLLDWQWNDIDGDIDYFNLPHGVDGRPFPLPQKAEYGDAKVSLAKVEIDTRVSRADPVVRLLKRKLRRFGSEFAPGGTTIELSLSPDAPVDKPQGYSLDVAPGSVRVQARTRLGLAYGVVSFLQCVDRGDHSIRTMRIEDWPKLVRRGVWESIWHPQYVEFALFNKMSSLMIKFGRPECSFVYSALDREMIRLSIARYRDFGMDVYWSANELTVRPILPFTSPRTRKLHLDWMRWAASFGAGVCFELDDERFYPIGLHPLDVKAAGTATNLDAKYITGLYREVKRDFPSFRMVFGPPFYFGPDGRTGKDWYPEPRDPYLRSLGEFLDPEIDVYWTGPRVKSAKFTPEKIKWYSNLVGRSPVVYHNADCLGVHNYTNYGADAPGFKKSHCPETLDMVKGFYQNTNFYSEMCRSSPAMDWCWNPGAHEAADAVRRATDMLEGPGVYDILAAAIPAISYFDKYPRGKPHGEIFMEDQKHLDRLVADAEIAWKRAAAIAKNGGEFVSGFKNAAIAYAKKISALSRNPPKWLVEQHRAEMANTSYAEREVGYSKDKGDQFLPAELILGGRYFSSVKDDTGRKPCGVKELVPGASVSGRFDCPLFPPENAPTLIIVGQAFRDGTERDVKVEMPEIELSVNGQRVWSGRMFADGLFKPFELKLPVNILQRSNTFTLRNADKEDFVARRRPMVHYAVVRK